MKPVELFNLVLGTCFSLMLVAVTMVVMYATARCILSGCI